MAGLQKFIPNKFKLTKRENVPSYKIKRWGHLELSCPPEKKLIILSIEIYIQCYAEFFFATGKILRRHNEYDFAYRYYRRANLRGLFIPNWRVKGFSVSPVNSPFSRISAQFTSTQRKQRDCRHESILKGYPGLIYFIP